MADPRSLLTHKLVLLGDTAVGKSCLAVRFVREEFLEFQEPTIGGLGLSPPAFSQEFPHVIMYFPMNVICTVYSCCNEVINGYN